MLFVLSMQKNAYKVYFKMRVEKWKIFKTTDSNAIQGIPKRRTKSLSELRLRVKKQSAFSR